MTTRDSLSYHAYNVDLITRLQVERGRTSFYRGKVSVDSLSELKEAYTETDKTFSKYLSALEKKPKMLKEVQSLKTMIVKFRQRDVSKLYIEQIMEFYTRLIAKLIKLNDLYIDTKDSEFSKLSMLKENIGWLRGYLSGKRNAGELKERLVLHSLSNVASEIEFHKRSLQEGTSDLGFVEDRGTLLGQILFAIKRGEIKKITVDTQTIFLELTKVISRIDTLIDIKRKKIYKNISEKINESELKLFLLVIFNVLISLAFSLGYYFNLNRAIRKNKELLEESRDQVSDIGRNIPGVILQLRVTGTHFFVMYKGGLLLSNLSSLISQNYFDFQAVLDVNEFKKLNNFLKSSEDTYNTKILYKEIFYEVYITRRKNILYCVFYDITQSQRDFEEKKLLYNELDHRVKNNLQMIQVFVSDMERDKDEKSIQKLQARVGALNLSHKYLSYYKDSNIELNKFTGELVTSLTEFLGDLSIKLDLDDYVISAKKVNALSLLLNELIMNSKKYCLVDKPEIFISGAQVNDQYLLTYTDKGKIEINNENTRGRSLIKLLANQLDASITMEYEKGASVYRLTFSK